MEPWEARVIENVRKEKAEEILSTGSSMIEPPDAVLDAAVTLSLNADAAVTMTEEEWEKLPVDFVKLAYENDIVVSAEGFGGFWFRKKLTRDDQANSILKEGGLTVDRESIKTVGDLIDLISSRSLFEALPYIESGSIEALKSLMNELKLHGLLDT